MKSKLNPVPAANRTQEKINNLKDNYIQLKPDEAQKLVTGIYELDAKVKLKDSQIATITKQKNDTISNLQQVITTKTVEMQNQLKEEYISVLHQINPKAFSANYEDWGGKYQGYKDLIVKGDYKTIKKHIPIHKQKLAQKIETEKLALAAKEAEKLDKAKEEAVSLLHQLHPHAYPVNYEDWPADIKARKLLDSGNLQAIEKNLVVYRELLKKELARQKEEVQNKDQLILQKEQDFKILNDTFSTKEEELKSLHDTLLAKNTAISEVSHKVKKTNRKLAAKDKEIEALKALLAQKELENQEKERLREELTRKEVESQEKDALLLAKELEKQESLIQKEREKEELLALKENELREKDELLLIKESEVDNKSAEKNRIIEELASNLLTKDEVIVSKDLKIGEASQSVKKANRKIAAKDKLLIEKEEKLKALIEQNRIENEELLTQLANKSHMKNQIIDELEEEVNLQKDEVVNLRIQNLEKELMTQEQEKLLIQKELELADKSLVKNQLIKEAKKLLAEKDNEFQNLLNQNTELLDQNEVLDLKMQFYDKEVKNKETEKEILLTQKQKLSFLVSQKEQEFQNLLIQKEIEQKELLIAKEMAVSEKSFAKNQVIDQLQEDITNLKQQLLDNQPIYRSIYLEDRSCQPSESLVERQMASLDLSSINLSPIDHGGQNQIVGNIIGNFDIDNQHITHSVVLGGEGSESFSIIDVENSH